MSTIVNTAVAQRARKKVNVKVSEWVKAVIFVALVIGGGGFAVTHPGGPAELKAVAILPALDCSMVNVTAQEGCQGFTPGRTLVEYWKSWENVEDLYRNGAEHGRIGKTSRDALIYAKTLAGDTWFIDLDVNSEPELSNREIYRVRLDRDPQKVCDFTRPEKVECVVEEKTTTWQEAKTWLLGRSFIHDSTNENRLFSLEDALLRHVIKR